MSAQDAAEVVNLLRAAKEVLRALPATLPREVDHEMEIATTAIRNALDLTAILSGSVRTSRRGRAEDNEKGGDGGLWGEWWSGADRGSRRGAERRRRKFGRGWM